MYVSTPHLAWICGRSWAKWTSPLNGRWFEILRVSWVVGSVTWLKVQTPWLLSCAFLIPKRSSGMESAVG